MHMTDANKLTCIGLFFLFKTMYHTFIISQTVFQDFNKIHVDNKTKSSYAYQELSLAKIIFFFNSKQSAYVDENGWS